MTLVSFPRRHLSALASTLGTEYEARILAAAVRHDERNVVMEQDAYRELVKPHRPTHAARGMSKPLDPAESAMLAAMDRAAAGTDAIDAVGDQLALLIKQLGRLGALAFIRRMTSGGCGNCNRRREILNRWAAGTAAGQVGHWLLRRLNKLLA
jgi:hypothetical protein